ncbi:LysR family transcriptional regulator [Bradyrhizobium sp. SSBR45G]|uniref:LysR family transcriptional regulator n=1 Tax=unclassified Bradyrhizobium TaxID=2631580 RepID=UPI00234296B7|nr:MULTISPECIES: LysR family transcriptional regulator [unclassified Bradyrhizobium]GLH80487.1 LysR family transcriptional regulator [Bradyrhizobium sp. SSBR45G]GLH87882.1 LysR family transcriptional regulator [Bradyrhizobium sp. SSBR45R]
MEPINLNRLVYFSAVVDAASFTRAADRLGITKAVVSQQVAQLERELKTDLLVRTTRRVEPTEAGRLLHARCAAILREAESAMAELAQSNAAPMGLLRIAAPNDYGTCTLAPIVTAFSRTYPACRVELILADSKVDLVASQIDVSIRVGWLDDSTLQTRRIGSFRQLLVAAPNVVKRVTHPRDLASLPFIANAALKEPLAWQFAKSETERESVEMSRTLTINTTPAVLAATLAGGGLAVLPDFLIRDDLAAGRLVPVLPSWTLPSGGIHAVFPSARFRAPKVTAFVTMLMDAHKRAAARGPERTR